MGLENMPVLETSTAADPLAVTEDRGIEAEVIGHLRIWHLVGISLAVLTSAVFLLCCCCNFRVPRSRQQIEENYLKRKMNKRYLRLLERNPEEPTHQRRGWSHIKSIGKSQISVTDSSGKVCFLKTLQKVSDHSGHTGEMRSRDGEADEDATMRQPAGQVGGYTLLPRLRATVGVETPAAFRPRDILAMMTQQPRLNSGKTNTSFSQLFHQCKRNTNQKQNERQPKAAQSKENALSSDQTV